jgi:hypothetical protein
MEQNNQVNAPLAWWGMEQWDIWDVILPTYPDGVTCDSTVYRVDSYKIRCDDEGID